MYCYKNFKFGGCSSESLPSIRMREYIYLKFMLPSNQTEIAKSKIIFIMRNKTYNFINFTKEKTRKPIKKNEIYRKSSSEKTYIV